MMNEIGRRDGDFARSAFCMPSSIANTYGYGAMEASFHNEEEEE